MQDLIDKFNEFFKDEAKIEIKRGLLRITVNSRTLLIKPPSIVGAHGAQPKPMDEF